MKKIIITGIIALMAMVTPVMAKDNCNNICNEVCDRLNINVCESRCINDNIISDNINITNKDELVNKLIEKLKAQFGLEVSTEKTTFAPETTTKLTTQITTNITTENTTEVTTKAPVFQPTTSIETTTETTTVTQTTTVIETTTETTTSAPNYNYAQQVLNLVNVEREKNGLSKLSLNKELTNVAQIKAEDMKNNNYFSHTSPTYGTPFEMMNKFGIKYRTAGENIAKGQMTPEEVVKGWMNSEGHRKNILNSSFTQMGLGYAKGNSTYWAQMFIG